MRHQPVDRAEQRRLARRRCGRSTRHSSPSSIVEVDVAQHRRRPSVARSAWVNDACSNRITPAPRDRSCVRAARRRAPPAAGGARAASRSAVAPRRRRDPRGQRADEDGERAARAGRVGHCSGCSDGLSVVGVDVTGEEQPGRDRDARRRDQPLGRAPRIGAVAGGARPAAAEREAVAGARRARPTSAGTPSQRGVGGVEQPVHADADAAQARRARARRSSARRAARGPSPCGRSPRASIAAASMSERSSASVITGTMTWRSTCGALAAPPRSSPRPPHPLRALDELRRDGECDRDRDADLVQRGRASTSAAASGWRARWPRRCRGAASRGAARRTPRRAPPRATPARRCGSRRPRPGAGSRADGTARARRTGRRAASGTRRGGR